MPDAVFVGNDQMALGLVRALADAGRSVPGDVSIVEFFHDVEGSDFFSPPLTTVRQEFTMLGQSCIATLVRLMEGKEDLRPFPIEPHLVVRASTAPKR